MNEIFYIFEKHLVFLCLQIAEVKHKTYFNVIVFYSF